MTTKLPGLDCGSYGSQKCGDFADRVEKQPDLLKRCTHLGTQANPEEEIKWTDIHGRDFDFILTHFPEDVGPREVILPHNPILTRELDIQIGDIVMSWCTVGPLEARKKEVKDLGYYSAQAYEGIVFKSKFEIKIGMRYHFQPKMCMLQWRHNGLINYINSTPEGLRVRIEGLWIG